MQKRRFVPRQLQPYADMITGFLDSFNASCQATRRNYIIKESSSSFESPRYSKYKVIYKSRYSDKTWLIYGEYRQFFFIKKQVPLFEIHIVGPKDHRYFSFSGLYTEGLENIPFETQALLEALGTYKQHCMSIPVEAFTQG